MTRQPYQPQDSIVFLTNRVGRLLLNHIRKAFVKKGYQNLVPHMGILVDLWAKDGVRQQDLAISNIKNKGAIARALDQMERDGLLERHQDPQDKRNKRIFLTVQGQTLQQELMPIAMDVIDTAQANIKPEQLQICKEVLMEMYTNLSKT